MATKGKLAVGALILMWVGNTRGGVKFLFGTESEKKAEDTFYTPSSERR